MKTLVIPGARTSDGLGPEMVARAVRDALAQSAEELEHFSKIRIAVNPDHASIKKHGYDIALWCYEAGFGVKKAGDEHERLAA